MKLLNVPTYILLAISTLFSTMSYGQTSPWGTGLINNQSLTAITGTTMITAHTGDLFDLTNYVPAYDFNIYIPNTYDGTKPYGVITFINSGGVGSIFPSWIPVLEEKNLIMIAGNNIGNSVSIKTRMGVALAGMLKLQEVLNIDTSRIFTSGNSGGARTASDLMLLFPEKFMGMLPNCGATYLRQVTQDYETHQPNSHYEYGYPFTQNQLAYVRSFDRRYALMTSYDDFREGDIMNIYHNGLEPDGFKAKILETAGGHCSTTTEHFRDALNFVEHPHIDVIRDSFNGTLYAGNGFQTANTSSSMNQLVFDHDVNNIARAYAKTPFKWNDDKGAIIRTSFSIDSLSFNQNTFFNIGLLSNDNNSYYTQNIGEQLYNGKANIIVSVSMNDAQPTISLLIENPHQSISNDTVFRAVCTDWASSKPLDIKFHIWNEELRLEFNRHFGTPLHTGSNVKLLDDNRSVQFRWTKSYWDTLDFNKATILTYVSGKINTPTASTKVRLQHAEVIVADTTDVLTPLAIDDRVKKIIDINIFPNPSYTGRFIIQSAEKNLKLNVYDITGKRLTTHNHHEPYTELDLSQYTKGVYLLQSADGEFSKKLMIK